jgi:hypothetical protein
MAIKCGIVRQKWQKNRRPARLGMTWNRRIHRHIDRPNPLRIGGDIVDFVAKGIKTLMMSLQLEFAADRGVADIAEKL